MNEKMNKLECIHTLEYYLAIKNEQSTDTHATTQMNLKNMLKERIQALKRSHAGFQISRTGKSTDKTQVGGCQGLWGKEREMGRNYLIKHFNLVDKCFVTRERGYLYNTIGVLNPTEMAFCHVNFTSVSWEEIKKKSNGG